MKVTVHLKEAPDAIYENCWNLMLLGPGLLGIYQRGPKWDPGASRLSTNQDYGPNHKLLPGTFLGWTTEPEDNDPPALTIMDIMTDDKEA